MQTLRTAIAMTGLVVLMGCSSYVKQPSVCIDRWYGYASDQGCSSTGKIMSSDSSQGTDARLAAEQQRLTEQLDAARRQNGALSNRVNDLEGQLADRDREIAALRSGSGDNAQLASQLSSSQQELRQSQNDKDRLAAELTTANRRITDLERQLAAANQRIADLEGQLAAAQSAKPAESPMAKLETAKQGLIRKLRPQIEKGDITIDLNSERLLIKLASRYLFGSGEDQLRPAGADALKQVGEVLKDYPEYAVSVEGHTDDRPLRSTLKKKFASNQELSEARAASAAKALANGGLSSTTTKGFADTNPVASNNSETDRAKNRRVEIRVTK